MDERQYFVYILANFRRTAIYVGVTNDLCRRLQQHRSDNGSLFVRRYNAYRLVFYEIVDEAYTAICREKQLKAGSRRKKIALIESMNPNWDDLADVFAL